MDILSSIISNELLLVIGQTILHSLWQGAALGLVCWLVLSFVRKENSHARYWIHVSGILSILILSIITFRLLFSSQLHSFTEVDSNNSVSGFANFENLNGLAESSGLLPNIIPLVLPYISVLWFVGILFFSFRLMGGILYIHRIKIRRNPIINNELQSLISKISRNIRLKKVVELAESAKVTVPIIIGHIKPILLFPVGALAGLPINQVEAIISHELAHIKRNDYLINLIFSIIEVLFFFHPVVWWMNSRIRANREILCDDLAVGITNDPANYARALTSVQAISNGKIQMAPAFSGEKGLLLNRIQRIYNNTQMKTKKRKSGSLAAILIMSCLLVLFSSSIQPMNSSHIDTQSSELISQKDTTIHTDVKLGNENFNVVLTYSGRKIKKLILDGVEIKKNNYQKFHEIIQLAKEVAWQDKDIDLEDELDLLVELEDVEEVEPEELIEIENDIDLEVELENEDLIEIEDIKEIESTHNVDSVERVADIYADEIIVYNNEGKMYSITTDTLTFYNTVKPSDSLYLLNSVSYADSLNYSDSFLRADTINHYKKLQYADTLIYSGTTIVTDSISLSKAKLKSGRKRHKK